MYSMTAKQTHNFARAIYTNTYVIKTYVDAHQDEYQQFLQEYEKENNYNEHSNFSRTA